MKAERGAFASDAPSSDPLTQSSFYNFSLTHQVPAKLTATRLHNTFSCISASWRDSVWG